MLTSIGMNGKVSMEQNPEAHAVVKAYGRADQLCKQSVPVKTDIIKKQKAAGAELHQLMGAQGNKNKTRS